MPDLVKSETVGIALDPRIVRSRRLLMDALFRLLTRKTFDDISIQEISDEATLNRATFYLHYPDKVALLQAATATRFRELILRRGLSFSNCDGALGAIALGVCEYFEETTKCPGQLVKMPLEDSIIPVVKSIFQEGFADHAMAPGSNPELLATAAAWAMFGAAREWYQTPDRISALQMAGKIEAMIKPLFLIALP